jgi:hypothetical protein
MTSISTQPPLHPPPVAGLFLYTTWTSKWKAVDSGRSNDVMHMIEFADLFQFYTPVPGLSLRVNKRGRPPSGDTQDSALNLRRQQTTERTRLWLLRLRNGTAAVTIPPPEQAAAGRDGHNASLCCSRYRRNLGSARSSCSEYGSCTK